jgi:5-hydroxyisourate hydrolase
MSAITTHVLDAYRGKPAAGIAIQLEKHSSTGWDITGKSTTDSDGRCRDLCSDCSGGTYRLTFFVRAYFESQNRNSIYPEILIVFDADGESNYHIPLLLSDNSYTTYRGS